MQEVYYLRPPSRFKEKSVIKQLEKLDLQRLPGDRVARYRNLLNAPLLSAQKLTSPFVPTLTGGDRWFALVLLPLAQTHSKGYWAKTETSWHPTKARGIANPPNIKKLKTLVVSLFCHKSSEYNRLKYLKPELGLWLSLAKLIRLWNWLMSIVAIAEIGFQKSEALKLLPTFMLI